MSGTVIGVYYEHISIESHLRPPEVAETKKASHYQANGGMQQAKPC